MICAIAKLSDDATGILSAIRNTALSPEQTRIPLYGHITLAAYLPEDDQPFVDACVRMFQGYPSFSVYYERLEVLPQTSIIVASPLVSDDLLVLHSMIVNAFDGSLDQWTGSVSWHPHTTLFHDPAADLNQLCRSMRQRFVPFVARVEQIQLSKVEKAGFTILKRIRLPQG